MAIYKIGFKLDDSEILPVTLKTSRANLENIQTHRFFKKFREKLQIVSAELISEDDDICDIASQCHYEFVKLYELGLLGMQHLDIEPNKKLTEDFFRPVFGLIALIKEATEKAEDLLQTLELSTSKET